MINQQLLDFIKSQLSKGIDKETATKELLENGWTQPDIDEGFNIASSQVQTSQSVPVPSNIKKSHIKISFLNILRVFVFMSLFIIIVSIFSEIFLPNMFRLNSLLRNIFNIINGLNPILLYISLIYFIISSIIYIKYKIKKDLTKINKSKKSFIWSIVLLILMFIGIIIPRMLFQTVAKPVIYLYPTQTQKIKVELDYKGKLIADYPAYDYSTKGWDVTAYPEGKIINSDGKEYSYLFWEGEPTTPTNYDLSTGFIVRGEDTISFLQDKLSVIGLTPKEYNEFIVYWYPKMKDNKYNLIHFADKQYTETAPLTITPKPDSMLRVFMVFRPLDREVFIKSQEIKPFIRTGFSVIEWGGTELK